MIGMHLNMDGSNLLDGVPENEVIQVETITVAALPKGMLSGKPSMAFLFELPDGRKVLAQTSMTLFHSAAKAFAARYGWQA